ncbi:Central kinetochore-associated [Penicillium atrosanguineum]|nr:Central kinetochore-associated [Penicillium atrosanguineum]
MSLLDFDIPPAPTPRSIPTVTPRELESLKSAFMSEISSLRATLSGKEAEVASLKTAVGDAERRVGEAWEEVRHEIARKEELEVEQEEWGRRGKEMETVLLSVRSELEDGERERDRLSQKVDETEKSKEQLEGRIVELETQLSAARSTTESSTVSGSRQTSQSTEDTAREVQDAVEKVARELHTLYKSKHETKVAALKKSYESRWEKRLREAERKLATAHDENDRLREERDAAQSDNMAAANASMISRENDEHEAEKRVLEAQIKGLQHEMASIKDDSERLRFELKSERAEKGELVAAVDEWLAIQNQPAQQPLAQEKRELSVSSTGPAEDEYQSSSEVPAENLRRSVSRSGSSGIRPPASGKKRIPQFGAGGGHSRGNSGGRSGIALPAPGRGGIMSSIERMGRGGA